MFLVYETEGEITRANKTTSDVLWVGSRDGMYAMSWNRFVERFSDVEYDDGIGSQEVATDLVVVFTDGSWLERWQYQGDEWWAYQEPPVRSTDCRDFYKVAGGSWGTLFEMNDYDDAA